MKTSRPNVLRHPKNPLIRPSDVQPSRPDFQVVCVFNCGVIRHQSEVLLLMRVAEIAKPDSKKPIQVPLFDPKQGKIIVKTFDPPSIPRLSLSVKEIEVVPLKKVSPLKPKPPNQKLPNLSCTILLIKLSGIPCLSVK
jgi:predicted GH43/DUF377 family glycosyl hydrolase